MDVVGDDAQVAVIFNQGRRHGLYGCPDAHKQAGAVGNFCRNQIGDMGFFILLPFFLQQVGVVQRGITQSRPAVIALQQAVYTQFADVAAYGLRRNIQFGG